MKPGKVSKQEAKRNKDLATLLLQANGTDYEDWLNDKHLEVVNHNSEVVEKALALFVSQKNVNE